MNILFLGVTGVHQTLLAASLHMDPCLSRDYHTLPYFNDYDQEVGGHPIYIGRDYEGRRIHSLGVGSDVAMVSKTMNQLRIILDSSADELQLVPITIKSQRFISWLHKLARLKWLKPLSSGLIAWLINMEHDHIKQQLPHFTNARQS